MACYYPFIKNDDEKRKILEEKYSDKIKASEEVKSNEYMVYFSFFNATIQGRQSMQDFFNKVKAGDDITNEKLNQALLFKYSFLCS